MLRIGSKVGYDRSGRVTVPRPLAEMLNLTRGDDLVVWSVEDGKAVLRKATTPLYGIDIEQEEIERNLREYESRFPKDASCEGLSEEERRRLAVEEYQRRKDTKQQ